MTVLKAFRLPANLAHKLSTLAKTTHRSEKFYVAEALTHYLEDYADAQIAKDRFNDPKSRIISGAKLGKSIGQNRQRESEEKGLPAMTVRLNQDPVLNKLWDNKKDAAYDKL